MAGGAHDAQERKRDASWRKRGGGELFTWQVEARRNGMVMRQEASQPRKDMRDRANELVIKYFRCCEYIFFFQIFSLDRAVASCHNINVIGRSGRPQAPNDPINPNPNDNTISPLHFHYSHYCFASPRYSAGTAPSGSSRPARAWPTRQCKGGRRGVKGGPATCSSRTRCRRRGGR